MATRLFFLRLEDQPFKSSVILYVLTFRKRNSSFCCIARNVSAKLFLKYRQESLCGVMEDFHCNLCSLVYVNILGQMVL